MTQNFTLLIVDDEKQNRILLLELLKEDYRIILAKNGTQALELAREHRPDLILLDVLMPGMDGYTVIRELKEDEQTRDIPVIFITALDSSNDETKGLELGAADYISKPFHPGIVRVRVRNHLQIQHQRRLLEKLSLLDSLTEIPNRRHFDQTFEQEWRRCLRTDSPLSLAIIDVDFFKNYNDANGHAAGDIALHQVAQCLDKGLRRAGDFVARYGGEEFVMLLPETGASDAKLLMEHIRHEIEARHLPHVHSSASPWITVSVGGATLTPATPETDSDLFRLADAYLYEAKHAGRNRVCWASSGMDIKA